MQKRKLGQAGLEVSAVGYGTMGLSQSYSTLKSREEATRAIHAAVKQAFISPSPRDRLYLKENTF